MKQPTTETASQQAADIGTPIIKALNYLYPVSDEIAAYMNSHVRLRTIRKSKYLLKSGTVCEYVYFVVKGALRGVIKDGSKEITTWITAENEFVTSITSFDLQIPALENIQALEDCELLEMSFSDFQNLYLELPEFNIIGRKLLESYYRDAEGRAYIVRLSKAEYRYNHFLKMHERLANRIPLKYIASYIGITLETLSRVRKKLSTQTKNKV